MNQAGSISRRSFLMGGSATAFGVLSRLDGAAAQALSTAQNDWRILRAQPGATVLRATGTAPTAIWGYDGIVPGPTLRVRRGEEVRVRLVNGLPEPTTIHWHGLRLPNAMDGVPHLTQAPVEPGASFDYRFVAPDAGTFWYHSHQFSSEQLARGLYGALIVEEAEPVEVDRDLTLMLDDWRLNRDGSIHTESFRSMHDAAHDGRIGEHLTVNGVPQFDIPVRGNERLRLRLINAANARVMTCRLARHRAVIIALDGQPTEPFIARDSRITLSPGNRVDLFVDALLEPGSVAPLILEDRDSQVEIARLVYDSGSPLRPAPLGEPRALPANALPARMAFSQALRIDVPLDGGMMSMAMRDMMRDRRPGEQSAGDRSAPRRAEGFSGAPVWAMAGKAADGHGGPPLFRVDRGRTVVMAMANRTMFNHAMHIHGHHFRLLDALDDGWKPFWLDTVLVAPAQTSRIAFVADNPGKWMIHCHMLEHQETGMAAWFEVT